MMMMCVIGNFGVTALLLLSLHLLQIMLLLLLVLLLLQPKEDIFSLSVVRTKPFFQIWSQCLAVMFQSKISTTNHFSGKFLLHAFLKHCSQCLNGEILWSSLALYNSLKGGYYQANMNQQFYQSEEGALAVMDHNVSFHMHMRVPLRFSVTFLSLSYLRLTISWLKMKDYFIILSLF